MDIVSHAGWGYALLSQKGRKMAAWGALAGAAPDLLFWIPSKIDQIKKYGWEKAWSLNDPSGIWRADGPPMPSHWLEPYHKYYVFTHSLVILAALVLVFWLWKKYFWLWMSLPYAFHIVLDIPTHERYRTPFLFPISLWTFQGWNWGNTWIFWPNWICLISAIVWSEWKFRSK